MFAALLAQSSLGSVAADIVSQTLSRLLEEIDPDDITLAKLIEYVKTKPVLPKRRYLPPPEDESGPAERPIYFPPDNGKEPFPVAHPDEAERDRFRAFYASAEIPATVLRRRDLGIREEHIAEGKRIRERRHASSLLRANTPDAKKRAQLANMLGNLAERMHLRCIRCAGEFTRLDIDAFVIRCMDAGRNDEPEPPRWCARCTPADPTPSDDAVPF